MSFTLLLACVATPARAAARIPDFSFVHCSDIHVPAGLARRTGAPEGPQFGSAEVVAQIKGLTGPVALTPYGVTAPPPAFAIATGDVTEFGGLKGARRDGARGPNTLHPNTAFHPARRAG